MLERLEMPDTKLGSVNTMSIFESSMYKKVGSHQNATGGGGGAINSELSD